MNRVLVVSSLTALLAGCFNFDALERTARCRLEDPNVTDCPAGDAGVGADGGADDGGTDDGGATRPVDFDAFTDGGVLEVPRNRTVRGAASSRTKTLEGRGLELTWMSESCEIAAGMNSGTGCARTWELGTGDSSVNLPVVPPVVYSGVDVPLSSAIGVPIPGTGSPLAYLGQLDSSLELAIDPRNTGGNGSFFRPWTSGSGATAWLGGRSFAALLASSSGLTRWHFDYDFLGARHELNVDSVEAFDACSVQVDDVVTALDADGQANGVAWFSVRNLGRVGCTALPAGASLVRVEGPNGLATYPDAGLGLSAQRLAARKGHVWVASGVDGGFELQSFDVSGDTPVSDFDRPLTVIDPDWTQVDVTADGQGRPYVVGNSSTGVQVASFELDGGQRFVLPVPGTTGVRAVAAAWTSRGLGIAGDRTAACAHPTRATSSSSCEYPAE